MSCHTYLSLLTLLALIRVHGAVDAVKLICTVLYESHSRIGVAVNFPIQSIHTVFNILKSIFFELSSCVLRDKYTCQYS